MTNIIGIDIDGPIDARPIVFLHAASYTRKMWLPQMRALSTEFRVIAVDLLGHGDRADKPFDFDAAVDDVIDTVNVRDLGPALFVGASLGGCIAMEVARRRPDLMAGMVLAGASFDATTLLCRLVLTGESIVFPRIESKLIRNFRTYIDRTMPVDIAKEMIDAGSYWQAAAAAVSEMRGRDFLSVLRTFDGPALIVNGARDWPHRFYERRFLRATKNGTLSIIEGANHICSLDAPEEFARLTREFAGRCRFPALQRARE